MKLPLVDKLGAITGVFSRLNPVVLFGKIKQKIKSKKGGKDDREEGDFRPSSEGDLDDMFADMEDMDLDVFDEPEESSEDDLDKDDDNTGDHNTGEDDGGGVSASSTTQDGDFSEEDAQILADLEAMPDFDDAFGDDDGDDDDDDDEARAKKKKLMIIAGGGVAAAVVLGGLSWVFVGGDAPKKADGGAPLGAVVLELPPAPKSHAPNPSHTPNPSGAVSAHPTPSATGGDSSTVATATSAPAADSGTFSGGSKISSAGIGGELANLGLDAVLQPGVGLVVPSVTQASFAGLAPWPPSPSLEVAPLANLVKSSDQGPLPIIAKDGYTPFEAYARPKPQGDLKKPKLAIILTGLGTSRAATEAVISGMPAEVSLALDVYARGLDFWVKKMRAAGHEVLLEMPSQSANFPFDDPGPAALKALAPPDENIKKLNYILSRTTGYFGVLSVYGGKFMTAEEQVKNLIQALKGRGLMYVDGGIQGSLAPKIAAEQGMPWAAVDIRFTDDGGKAVLSRQFVQAEQMAKARSVLVVRLSVTPLSLRMLSTWIKQLDAKGIRLVPVSSLAKLQTLK